MPMRVCKVLLGTIFPYVLIAQHLPIYVNVYLCASALESRVAFAPPRNALFPDSDALPVNAASRKLSELVVPRCTYTEPEVASCGVSNDAWLPLAVTGTLGLFGGGLGCGSSATRCNEQV